MSHLNFNFQVSRISHLIRNACKWATKGINNESHGNFSFFQVIDLKTQFRYFKKVETWFKQKLGNVEAKMTLSKAVYLFSIGTNDYMSTFLTNSTMLDSYSDTEYVGIVIGNLTAVIKVSVHFLCLSL